MIGAMLEEDLGFWYEDLAPPPTEPVPDIIHLAIGKQRTPFEPTQADSYFAPSRFVAYNTPAPVRNEFDLFAPSGPPASAAAPIQIPSFRMPAPPPPPRSFAASAPSSSRGAAPGVSTKTIAIIGGVVLVGVIAVVALKKKKR